MPGTPRIASIDWAPGRGPDAAGRAAVQCSSRTGSGRSWRVAWSAVSRPDAAGVTRWFYV